MRQQHIGSYAALLCGAFAALMLVVGSARAQNLLANPDLDNVGTTSMLGATPTNWNAASSKQVEGAFNDGMSSETFANVQQPQGFGVFFKPFQGSTTDKVSASLSQTVAGSPAQPYTMTGWAGAEANYIGLSDPTVGSLFKMEFLNSLGNTIGSPLTLNLVTAGLGQGTPTPPATGFGYHQYSLSGTSPAGTAFVRVTAEMDNAYANPLGGGQAFVVDAFSLAVPEPATFGACAALIGLAALRRRRSR